MLAELGYSILHLLSHITIAAIVLTAAWLFRRARAALSLYFATLYPSKPVRCILNAPPTPRSPPPSGRQRPAVRHRWN